MFLCNKNINFITKNINESLKPLKSCLYYKMKIKVPNSQSANFSTKSTGQQSTKNKLKSKNSNHNPNSNPNSNPNKKSNQHNTHNSLTDMMKENSILIPDTENWDTNDFLQELQKNTPIKLNSQHYMKSDKNLSCFIPFEKIINKTKAIALAKHFLDSFFKYLNSGDDEILNNNLFEENLINKILTNLNEIISLKKDPNANIYYKTYLKSSDLISKNETVLKKTNFNINMYNINNFMFLGVDSDRKIKKNNKFVSVHKDILFKNIFSTKEDNNVKVDIISQKNSYQTEENNSNIPFTLISQFQFTLIPSKSLFLEVEVEDKLNEKKSVSSFVIEGIDFLAECEMLKMSLNEFNELNNKISSLQAENEEEKNAKYIELMNKDNIHEKFNYNLRIVDVDSYLNGNDLI